MSRGDRRGGRGGKGSLDFRAQKKTASENPRSHGVLFKKASGCDVADGRSGDLRHLLSAMQQVHPQAQVLSRIDVRQRSLIRDLAARSPRRLHPAFEAAPAVLKMPNWGSFSPASSGCPTRLAIHYDSRIFGIKRTVGRTYFKIGLRAFFRYSGRLSKHSSGRGCSGVGIVRVRYFAKRNSAQQLCIKQRCSDKSRCTSVESRSQVRLAALRLQLQRGSLEAALWAQACAASKRNGDHTGPALRPLKYTLLARVQTIVH